MKKDFFCIFLIFAISLYGLKALFQSPYLFSAHDIWHNVARLYFYNQAIIDGAFPPYWINTLLYNHGYPLFVFSFHLPWLIGTLFLQIGLDLVTTYKLLIFLGFVLSGISMYFCTKLITKNKLAGLLSSILYLWSPYHFFSIFVAGTMGILYSFIFLPLFFLGTYKAAMDVRSNIPSILLLALSTAGFILSHFISAFLSFWVILFWGIALVILAYQKNQTVLFFKRIFIGIILGLLIASFYLLPAFYYSNQTVIKLSGGFASEYPRNFVNFSQLVYSKWGYGPIINNAKDGEVSFQIGIAQWLSMLFLFLLLVRSFFQKESHIKRILLVAPLFGFVGSVFLMLDLSKPLWDLVTTVISLDYPFRTLMAVSFIASIAAGLVLTVVPKKLQLFVTFLLLVITFYTNRNHINVNMHVEKSPMDFVSSEVSTNTHHEYRPILSSAEFTKDEGLLLDPEIPSMKIFQNTQTLEVSYQASASGSLSISQLVFPGQTLYVDGKKSDFNPDSKGRIQFLTQSGTHTLKVSFEDTQIIKLGKALSSIGLIILFVMISNAIYAYVSKSKS